MNFMDEDEINIEASKNKSMNQDRTPWRGMKRIPAQSINDH